jgi:predicted alpha/beta hydrolase family esterase
LVDRVLLVPGIYNSGSRHWQSLWEQHDPAFVRVKFDDWDNPRRERWVETLESTLRELGPTTVVVAHSLGCLAVAHWASSSLRAPIHAAFLACVPDPLGPNFPGDAQGFAPLPLENFGFRSLIVASEDDPYSTSDHVRRCAAAWGSQVINVGAKGHINADSNLGAWAEGRDLLKPLLPPGATVRADTPAA